MAEPPNRTPEADRRASRQGFLWAFGLCAGLPPLGVLTLAVVPDNETLTLVALFGPLVLWTVALVASLVLCVIDRQRGLGALIGVLAGVVVGFSLCSGALPMVEGAL